MQQLDSNKLTRRQVIERALLFSGAAGVVSASTLVAACSSDVVRSAPENSELFSAAQIAWLDEVAETILPETDTPGAKAANTGAFIALMVSDTYSPEEQDAFFEGMATLEGACRASFGTGFVAATPADRLALLQRIDQERQEAAAPHYFEAIKSLTVLGYFTSEIGYTQALRYVESPGRYDPCVEYQPGERLWARHA